MRSTTTVFKFNRWFFYNQAHLQGQTGGPQLFLMSFFRFLFLIDSCVTIFCCVKIFDSRVWLSSSSHLRCTVVCMAGGWSCRLLLNHPGPRPLPPLLIGWGCPVCFPHRHQDPRGNLHEENEGKLTTEFVFTSVSSTEFCSLLGLRGDLKHQNNCTWF